MKRRWHLLHVGSELWTELPDKFEIPLEVRPGHDTTAYIAPSLLVLRAVGGTKSKQEVYGLDLVTGKLLWEFSETDEDLIFFSCYVDGDWIIATTRFGLYRLTSEGPKCILKGSFGPASAGRLTPDHKHGYVLDDQGRLVLFELTSGHEETKAPGKVLWSRRAPKSFKFQNPFPTNDGAVCLSVGQELRKIQADGETAWRWPAERVEDESYAIEKLVRPDILLVRVSSPTNPRHCTIDVETGKLLSSLGDVWSYGADGITEHPVVLFEGQNEEVTFLNSDGSRTNSQKIKRMVKGFCSLPEGCAALHYDAFLRFVVCTDSRGKVAWKYPYPDARKGLSGSFFSKETAYFATGTGTLHVWDVGGV